MTHSSDSPHPSNLPNTTPDIDFAAYVNNAAPMLGFELTPETQQGVIDNLERIYPIAQLVNEFPLPSDLEAAPQFEP